MKNKGMTLRFLVLLCALAAVVFAAYGCEPPPSEDGPSVPGDYTKCTYTAGLSDDGYASAIVYYPCNETGPFAATTLTGGWTNTKEQMTWIGDHLVTHGYVIIAMTPNNNLGNNPQWETAHKAGIAKLITENARAASPIYGMVDTANLQIMGYSKGGGGALLAAADLGSQVKSTQALAPYMDSSYSLSGVRSATICYTGTDDSIASPGAVVNMYNALPDSIERTLAYFDGFGHLMWINGGDAGEQSKAKTYITSWMKVYLDGDASYSDYIAGNQDWFYIFAHNQDAEGGGGCN